MKSYFLPLAAAALIAAYSCNTQPKTNADTNAKSDSVQLVDQDAFSDTLNGKMVSIFYLRNGSLEASITNYGGRVVNLLVPDKEGKAVDVAIGSGNFKDMYNAKDFFGAIIGRYGNRI